MNQDLPDADIVHNGGSPNLNANTCKCLKVTLRKLQSSKVQSSKISFATQNLKRSEKYVY